MEETWLNVAGWKNAGYLWVLVIPLAVFGFWAFRMYEEDPRPSAANWAVLWVPLVLIELMALCAVGSACTRVRLTPDRIEFRGPVARRSIPWAEVTAIEPHLNMVKGSCWWVRIHRRRGRKLTVPGVYCYGRGEPDEKFQRNLETLRDYWANYGGDAGP